MKIYRIDKDEAAMALLKVDHSEAAASRLASSKNPETASISR